MDETKNQQNKQQQKQNEEEQKQSQQEQNQKENNQKSHKIDNQFYGYDSVSKQYNLKQNFQEELKQKLPQSTKIMSWNVQDWRETQQFVQGYIKSLQLDLQLDVICLQEVKIGSEDEQRAIFEDNKLIYKNQLDNLHKKINQQIDKIILCNCFDNNQKCVICGNQEQQLRETAKKNYEIVLQSTFTNLSDIFEQDYHHFANYGKFYNRGKVKSTTIQSGVSIYLNKKYPLPLKVKFDFEMALPCDEHKQGAKYYQDCQECKNRDQVINKEGRTIILEYENFYLIGSYFPNPESKPEFRKYWDEAFFKYVEEHKKLKKLLLFGDLNASCIKKFFDKDKHAQEMFQKLKGIGAEYHPDQQFTLLGEKEFQYKPYNQLDFFISIKSEKMEDFFKKQSFQPKNIQDYQNALIKHKFQQENKVPDHLPIFFSFEEQEKQKNPQNVEEKKEDQQFVEKIQTENIANVQNQINKVIDSWHTAAREHNGKYFDFFTDDAQYIGTDPNEKWNFANLKNKYEPIFNKGKGFDIVPEKRCVYVNKDMKTAWFDEKLNSYKMGKLRGSGVLVIEEQQWKIAQYVLSMPIPNEKILKVKNILEIQQNQFQCGECGQSH